MTQQAAMQFCEMWCDDFTPEQSVMVTEAVKRGVFLGVGRAIGSMRYWPLVTNDARKIVDVIDPCGYRQLAAIAGRIAFKEVTE